MSTTSVPTPRRWIAPLVLLGSVLGAGALLAAWKRNSNLAAAAAMANQPEPVELVTLASAEPEQHRQSTTAIGTVRALRSITLRNELSGTVRQVSLSPGQIVDSGTVLVALDVSVEQAELAAQDAEAALAQSTVERLQRLREHQATSLEEMDQARAQLDVARARIARTRAIIDKKTVRAPFRARVGLADIHPGQYLNEGVELTTLQGVSDAVHVDFAVAQSVAAALRPGSVVGVIAGDRTTPAPARIVAVDARVDPATRNATVRALLPGGAHLSPGASVRVQVPVGPAGAAVAVPVSALRKGPAGDHVFVVRADSAGQRRAFQRPVISGAVLGERVLILSGLDAGEQVAASGSFKLREGVRVETPAAQAARGN